ncbi:MAG: DUF4286 family protein [Pedobacter sp.]|nr:MAG: DUF4286 family protein [Pedobacter sp.]
MLVYNVTTIVEDPIADEWFAWMNEEHIPHVMATGKFTSSKLLKVIDSPNEGVTFCAQFMAQTKADYDSYINIHAPALRDEVTRKFPEKLVSFRSLMEVVG